MDFAVRRGCIKLAVCLTVEGDGVRLYAHGVSCTGPLVVGGRRVPRIPAMPHRQMSSAPGNGWESRPCLQERLRVNFPSQRACGTFLRRVQQGTPRPTTRKKPGELQPGWRPYQARGHFPAELWLGDLSGVRLLCDTR